MMPGTPAGTTLPSMMREDESGIDVGAKFWLALVGGCIAFGIAGMIVFLLIGWAWYAWGFIGAIVFICGTLLLIAYMFDRRSQKRYDSLPE
jgi:Flp pilus assembly protein TadB